MTTSSLAETLPFLDAAVPAVSGKVGAVVAQGEAYKKAVQEYLDRLDSKRAAIEKLKEQVVEALEALESTASDERPVLEGSFRELDDALDQARTALEQEEREARDGLEDVGRAMTELRGRLGEVEGRLGDAQEEVLGRLEGLRGGMASSQSSLGDFVDTAVDTGDGAETVLSDVRQAVEKGTGELAEQMQTFADKHVDARLKETAERIEGLFGKHEDAVNGAAEALGEGCQGLAESTAKEIGQEIVERGSDKTAKFGEAVLNLGTTHDKAQEAASSEREEGTEAAQGVEEWIEPLDGAVAEVKRAASVVGLDWPA